MLVQALAHEGRMDVRVGGDAAWHIPKEQEGFSQVWRAQLQAMRLAPWASHLNLKKHLW